MVVIYYPLESVKIASLCLTTEREKFWVGSEMKQILRLLTKSDALPARKSPLLHPVTSRRSDSGAAEGNMGKPGIPGSISIFPGSASSLFTPLLFYMRFLSFHRGQRSFGSGPFSPALISKSQVESCPAMELLASLSHSSLTLKQLVTRTARILFCFPRARRTFCHDHRLQCIL